MERRKKIMWKGNEVEAVELHFQTGTEHWNEYLVDDGTVIRQKTVASEILRIDGEFDNDGNPIYIVKSASLVAVSSPENLRKKGSN